MSLFDKDYRYTDEASSFEGEVYRALRPIFDRWLAKGKSPRELSHIIITLATGDFECAAILDMATKAAANLPPSPMPYLPQHVAGQVCASELPCEAVRCQNAEGKTRHCGQATAYTHCHFKRGLCNCMCEGCTFANDKD
jgi:hypothetical protein